MTRYDSRTILLLHPPYADITYPYHALSYVAAPLRYAGYNVEVLDVNALWFRSLFRKTAVQALATEAKRRFDQLDGRPAWDFQAQQEAAGLLATMAVCSRLRPEHAVNVLQNEAFYDYEHYAWAQQQVQDFERVLTQFYGPYAFATSFSIPPYHPNVAGLIQHVAASSRFKTSLIELLGRHLRHDRYLFCGVTIPFTAQMLPGMVLLDALGELMPGMPRVAGGTAVVDIVKACAGWPEVLRAFAHLAEFFSVGEAELGIVELARWLGSRRGAPPQQVLALSAPAVQQAPGYVALSMSVSKRSANFTPYDWRQMPPDYGWIDWSLYLSPRRHINYAPARGCFWNKCTFCDYGLNGNRPTAPSRTMEADVVIQHMQELVNQGVNDVYFAVDAIEPRFLENLAKGLAHQRLPLPLVHGIVPDAEHG